MIKTLQGINLESETSIVKIPLQGDNIGDIGELIDKVASFHQIFLKEYTLTPTLLTITSKLPFLWRDASETLIKLSKQEITFEEANESIINLLIKRRVKSMSTISVLEACIKRNIEITPSLLPQADLNEIGKNRYYTLGCGKGSHITCSASSTKDSHIGQKTQKDKISTNSFIQRLQLPIPKWEVLTSKSDIEKIWGDFKKPVVIKPNGLTAGRGITVGIDSIQRAKQAFDDAQEMIDSKQRSSWQKEVLIQEQVKGEDYRLLVINGKLQAVTKRIPAFVIGDGKKSIQELIKQENADPKRDINNPSHILKPIEIDKPLIQLLKDSNLTLDSIPAQEEKIAVRKVASMSQGGITEDCTNDVSKEIRLTVESIASSLHVFTLGVDIICLDITKPLTKENGGILEVNMMPEMYLNLYPVLGTKREYIANIYADELLKENSCKKYVVIGQSTNDLPTLLRKKGEIKSNEYIGEIIDDKYLINGLEISSNLENWKAIESIKCNALLDVIIINHRNWKEVEENGLGVEYIDTLFITKELSSNKQNMKILKQYKRRKLINKIKIIQ